MRTALRIRGSGSAAGGRGRRLDAAGGAARPSDPARDLQDRARTGGELRHHPVRALQTRRFTHRERACARRARAIPAQRCRKHARGDRGDRQGYGRSAAHRRVAGGREHAAAEGPAGAAQGSRPVCASGSRKARERPLLGSLRRGETRLRDRPARCRIGRRGISLRRGCVRLPVRIVADIRHPLAQAKRVTPATAHGLSVGAAAARRADPQRDRRHVRPCRDSGAVAAGRIHIHPPELRTDPHLGHDRHDDRGRGRGLRGANASSRSCRSSSATGCPMSARSRGTAGCRTQPRCSCASCAKSCG